MNSKQIEIIEGFYGSSYTSISPAVEDAQRQFGYKACAAETISISHQYLLGFLRKCLDKYYCVETQLEIGINYDSDMKYDEYGFNFYTPGQMNSIISELEEFVRIAIDDPFDKRCLNYFNHEMRTKNMSEYDKNYYIKNEAAVTVDFYSRFIARTKRMLQNMEGYDLIVFEGP